MIPLVIAVEECQDIMEPKDIPCMIISNWEYDSCTATTLEIYNSNKTLVDTINYTDYGVGGFCNVTWNITTRDTYYLNVSNKDTLSITVQSEDEEMASISITIFILLVTGALFWLSAKKELLKNRYADFIVRKSFIVLGIFLMILNSAIMATIAENAGIGLTQEMFFFMKLFGYLGYPAMAYLAFSTLIRSLKEWKIEKRNKRTGEEDGET